MILQGGRYHVPMGWFENSALLMVDRRTCMQLVLMKPPRLYLGYRLYRRCVEYLEVGVERVKGYIWAVTKVCMHGEE